MKPTTKNRWLKLLAWLLVIVIIVMLLIPSDLTDEQLAQIKPGMTIDQVYRLLGEPAREWKDVVAFIDLNDHRSGLQLNSKGKWSNRNLSITIDESKNSPLSNSHGMQNIKWTGANHLLWVEHNNGIVTKIWLFPITRTGGGLQGCIGTIKQYWNDWRK